MATDLHSPSEPTFYFIGMTTAKSSIMKVFPAWVAYLGLEVRIVGIDRTWHDTRGRYREVVQFVKEEPHAVGGLVTTHKIDILDAARDLFDGLGDYARTLGEISSISKRNGKLWGHAKDPITSGLSLQAFIGSGYWKNGAALCLLGAGGSSLAMTVYCMEQSAENRPGTIVVTDRSKPRLKSMKRIHEQINPGIRVEYHFCLDPADNDVVVGALPAGSVVANATGLGKDAPGSPLTWEAVFPEGGWAWDFNYRGDLLFLEQARAQQRERNLGVEDGWIYFIQGWTRGMAEVFHIDLPTSGPEFDTLSKIASDARRS